MAMNGLVGLAALLEKLAHEQSLGTTGATDSLKPYEIQVDPEIGQRALKSINRMLDFANLSIVAPAPDATYADTYGHGMGPA
jgi:quinolinate synthase